MLITFDGTNMKARHLLCAAGILLAVNNAMGSDDFTLASAPPVVVRTEPPAGSSNIPPDLLEIRVTFSKKMRDQNWSWVTHLGREYYPETIGVPHYLEDGRTCILPVKLKPGHLYAIWLNTDKYRNFMDLENRPAVPYLLSFTTAETNEIALLTTSAVPATTNGAPSQAEVKLDADQRAVLAWTDRQFRSFFDARTFEAYSAGERIELESRSIDALKGPQSREYFQAIGTIAALGGTNGLPALRQLAFERRDKNNRDRWMAVRALGLMGDRESVPELIHLVYHGNVNTRWWAQISLVRITGQNFGSDWQAWGKWWNEQKGHPPYNPELIRWWEGQAPDTELAKSLAESDEKFLAQIRH